MEQQQQQQESDYATKNQQRNYHADPNHPGGNQARRPDTVDSCYGSMHSEGSTKPTRNNYSVPKSESYGIIKSEPTPGYGVIKADTRISPSNFLESRSSPSYTIMKPATDSQTYAVKPDLHGDKKESIYVSKRLERQDTNSGHSNYEDHPSTHRSYPKSENSAFKVPTRNESLYASRRQELPPSYQETRSNYESMKPHDPTTTSMMKVVQERNYDMKAYNEQTIKNMEQEVTHHPAHHPHHNKQSDFKSYEKPNCDILLKPSDSEHNIPLRMKPLQYNEPPMYPPYGRPEVSPGSGASRSRESTPTSKELEAINDPRHHHMPHPQQQFYLC
uniref:Uncharacterized protein n=2 Tax=Cacopsylla melanoneura TaxID=428564 RepID=A0A8D8QNI4_9HEMI